MIWHFYRKRIFYKTAFWKFCRKQIAGGGVPPLRCIIEFLVGEAFRLLFCARKFICFRTVEDAGPYKACFPPNNSLRNQGLGGP